MDKPERVNLSWNAAGNVFISDTDPTTAYVRADVVKEMMIDLRDRCRSAAHKTAPDYVNVCWRIMDVPINATGESDE